MNSPSDEPDLSLPKGLSAYLRTRLQLVSIESREACQHFQGKLLPALVVAICALSIYLLVLSATVSLLGKVLSMLGNHLLLSWEIAAFLVVGLHIVIIFAMKKKLTKKPKAPLFEYSRAELERDREWLQEHNPTNKNSSTD